MLIFIQNIGKTIFLSELFAVKRYLYFNTTIAIEKNQISLLQFSTRFSDVLENTRLFNLNGRKYLVSLRDKLLIKCKLILLITLFTALYCI